MVDERQQEWKLLPFERWVQSEDLQVITTHTVPDIFRGNAGSPISTSISLFERQGGSSGIIRSLAAKPWQGEA